MHDTTHGDFDNLAKHEPLLTVHDEIVVVGDYAKIEEKVVAAMQAGFTLPGETLTIPLEVSGTPWESLDPYARLDGHELDEALAAAEVTPETPILEVDSIDSKKPLTRAEAGKLNRQHFTVQHQRCQPCGHKFVPGKEPRHRHCESCWFTFFTVYGELTRSADDLFRTEGEAALIQIRGRNFTNNFKKYMSTLAQWKAVTDAAMAAEAQQNGSTEDGSVLGPGSTGSGSESTGTGNWDVEPKLHIPTEDKGYDGEIDGKFYGGFD